MDASESSYCSFCKHTHPIDEFGVKQNGCRMKLCKRYSEYHQTRRLRITAAKVVTKAESSALAIADLKRCRASTVTIDDCRVSPYTPHLTPIAPVSKITTTLSSSAPELQTLPNFQDYSTPEIQATPRLLTPIVPSQEQEQS